MVPAGIGTARQDQAEQQEGAGRQASLGKRNRENQLGMPWNFAGLGAEPARDFLDIQAKCGGVSPQKTDRVDVTRQMIKPPAFERFEIGGTDSQHGRNVRQIPSLRCSRAARRSAPARGASVHAGTGVSICDASVGLRVFNDNSTRGTGAPPVLSPV